jgi:hypothetical protein
MDPMLRHRLWGAKASLPELQKAFKARVQFLGVIPTNENHEEDWEVYRLFWDGRG